ncbi:MAG TPA: 5-formyltetrahydrofolate cyclo-ligase [Candidatus Mcinerneyibacteriales bacterium]|nr:5-formyltetrahydrofolate cyclo-ligase [Candidatus Mcinerneyibacteriales bacterium]HPQ89085.1 5-formyltetrahydrofolate cyclo-ligase [Candidatus Mcinerneyibacteriales bacterium]
MDSIPDKSRLRREKIEERKGLTPGEWARRSRAVVEKLLHTDLFQNNQTFHVTFPMNNEVDIRPLIRWIWSKGKRVVMPRTDFTEKRLVNYIVHSFDDLEPTRFHMHEPKMNNPPFTGHVDLILVPGVAYDKKCNRLGYGGGFYDRFLTEQKAFCLAPAFDFQIIERLPVESHDRPADLVITEKRSFKLSS